MKSTDKNNELSADEFIKLVELRFKEKGLEESEQIKILNFLAEVSLLL